MRFTHPIPANHKILLARSSMWKRIVAFLIDLFIINSFLFIPFRKLFDAIPRAGGFTAAYSLLSYSNELRSFIFKVTLFAALVAFLYFVLFEIILSQSLGQMLFNIYVIPAVKTEKELKENLRIGFWKAVIRNLFVFPFFPFILLWIIEPITMLFNPLQQRSLELITKTRTVERYIR